MNTANLFSCFGDVIELDLPRWNLEKTKEILDNHTEWKPYNPRKSINRYGLSVTSLDGGYSGIPDLDSILEYNKLHGLNLTEKDFQTRTPIVNEIPELRSLLSVFGDDVGRSHFLKLNAGGFFPPHRDNGSAVPSESLRVVVPLINVGKNSWKWLQEDRLLYLEAGHTYCINTTKEHSVFSFVDNCTILVLNLHASPRVVKSITTNLAVR